MSILVELANDTKIKDACKKIDFKNHEDLYQELFVILCELPKEKLAEIHSSGHIQYWIVRTLLNMTSPRGNFYKKYHIINDDTEADARIKEEEGEDREQVLEFEAKTTEIDTLLKKYERQGRDGFGWYKVNLLKLYCEVGSFRKLGELTGISYRTICLDVNDFIRELRANLNIADN